MPLKVNGTTLYTVTEATKVAGVARQTLWNAIKSGLVPSICYAYRVFVKADDLFAWKERYYRQDMAERRRKGLKRKAKAKKTQKGDI